MQVRSKRIAAVFGNQRQRRILLALAAGEHTASELAARTGSSLSLLDYHLRKLTGLGLVRMTRQIRRAGRPVKSYRATADAFFVPAELNPALCARAAANRLRLALERARSRSLRGVLFTTEAGRPRMQIVEHEERRAPTTELWLEVEMTASGAEALASELRALFRRHQSRARGLRRYILHAAIAPD